MGVEVRRGRLLERNVETSAEGEFAPIILQVVYRSL